VPVVAAAWHTADAAGLGWHRRVLAGIRPRLTPGCHPGRRQPGCASCAGHAPGFRTGTVSGEAARGGPFLRRPDRDRLRAARTATCAGSDPDLHPGHAIPGFRGRRPATARQSRRHHRRAARRWFTAPELSAGGPVVTYARRCLRQADRAAWAAALDAIASYDRVNRVGAIGVPSTLIAGELDQVSTPAAMSALAGRLPRASLHVLPGAAHMTPFSDPGQLARLISRAAPG
jgi:pimeloyl-ACP methyl ester carboxylesterase